MRLRQEALNTFGDQNVGGPLIPVLYWLLECRTCGFRRVVHDSYFKFVGHDRDEPVGFGTGYGRRRLEERHACLVEGCEGPVRPIGSIFTPDDDTMRVHETNVAALVFAVRACAV